MNRSTGSDMWERGVCLQTTFSYFINPRFRNTGKLGSCEAIGLLLLVSRCRLTVSQMLFDFGRFGEETLPFFFRYGY